VPSRCLPARESDAGKGARDGIAFVALLNYDVFRGNTVSP
jgi:hypothetical protein